MRYKSLLVLCYLQLKASNWYKCEKKKTKKTILSALTKCSSKCIPLQYSCLENPMDGGAWKAAVHGIAEGQTRLSDLTFTFHFHALEKEMATHSSVLAWRIPGTGEPGGLPSVGWHRVGHDWSDLAASALMGSLSILIPPSFHLFPTKFYHCFHR